MMSKCFLHENRTKHFRGRISFNTLSPSPHHRLELTFYKNSTIHWFVLEGIVATALYASIKPHIRVAQVHYFILLFFPFPSTLAQSLFVASSLLSLLSSSGIILMQPEDISKFKVNKRHLLNDVRFVSQLLKLVRPAAQLLFS